MSGSIANVQEQADRLLLRGNITAHEAAALVDARNKLLLNMRRQLSPFGQLYSELLKPRATLKDFDRFLRQKGTIEAVINLVGKTRQVVSGCQRQRLRSAVATRHRTCTE